MGPDRLGFQKFVVFLAIAPHHRDRTNLKNEALERGYLIGRYGAVPLLEDTLI